MELQERTFRAILLLVLPLVLVHAQDEVTPLVGSIGDSVALNCDLPLTDPPNMAWKDSVYSMDRNPVTIFCTNMGKHEDHYNHDAYDVTMDNPTELTINDLKDSDVGNYYCTSTQEDGTTLEQQFTLGLAGAIECESESETDDLSEGDSIDASCKVPFTASVSPQFKWYIGEEDIGGSDKSQFGELWIEHSLDATKEMDQQKLTCKLSFHGFQLECAIPLSVKHAPYVKMFEDSIGEDKKKHSFSCTASANPAPTIDILKLNDDDTTTSLDSSRAKVTRDGYTATVTFSKLKKEDAGRYSCEASNANGETSTAATLTVSEKPIPTTAKPDGGNNNGGDKKPAGGDGGAGSQFVLATSLAILGFSMLLHVL